MYLIASWIGGVIIVRLIVLLLKKFAFKSRDSRAILLSNAAALLIATVLGGYGGADGASPNFAEAFMMYSVPVGLSLAWDFWRQSRRKNETVKPD